MNATHGSIALVTQARARVEAYMQGHFRKSLADLEMASSPGYWQDKEAQIHHGHPLHGCLGCAGPFKATYYFRDSARDPETGRWLKPFRSWEILKAAQGTSAP